MFQDNLFQNGKVEFPIEMCIRDRAKGILTEQRFMKLTAALEQEQEANQKRLHAVSYTHLDVYKRQAALPCSLIPTPPDDE